MHDESISTPQSAPNFSLAFKQMASFVAIAKTRATTQTLDQLILQCFVVLPDDRLCTPDEVVDAMLGLFGIPVNPKDVAIALERLSASGRIIDIGNGHLSLTSGERDVLNERIVAAKALEQSVRESWLEQAHACDSKLDSEKLWSALLSYLQQSFRRHGIQAVELLNPEVELSSDKNDGPSAILDNVVTEAFPHMERESARHAISSFFQTVSLDRKRAEYISSLADAAFNYFSLGVAPEISEKLRGNLKELTLFLDTNFLFGILNLHVNSQVDVSSELLEAIRRFKLPFRLRYHEATVREMTNTLFFYGKELKKHTWPQKISRAVMTSGALTGVELRYHSKNAEQPVSVEDFFAPLQHWQILLKDKGIDVYKSSFSEDKLRVRASLEAEYNNYLSKVNRSKPADAVQHDMTVMETVQSLRTNSKTTLDAGALLVTCDYHLFRFDFEQCRQNDRHHSTVLPSLIWQIIRPFVSDNEDFDKAFAETFVLPEFSLARGGARRAASRMASILACYSEIPEETASKMLANDLLIAELESKGTDAEFVETVDSAIVAENNQLMEERASLALQLEAEELKHETRQRELEAAEEQVRIRDKNLEEKDQLLFEKDEAIRTLQVRTVTEKETAKLAARQEIEAHEEREKASLREQELIRDVETAESRAAKFVKLASVVIGLSIVGLFEFSIRFVFPWRWLLDHPQNYGLEACFCLGIFFGIVGLGVKSWRKTLWLVGFFGVLFVVLEIVGGSKPATP